MKASTNTWIRKLFLGSLFLALITGLCPCKAGILSASNQVTVISPPPSVVANSFSTNMTYLFAEQTSFTLTNTVRVDISRPGNFTNSTVLAQTGGATNLFAGTLVDSYFLHHAGFPTNTASAVITFDTNIIGIICISSNLAASHLQLGAPGTTYQLTPATQGYELGLPAGQDRILFSANRRTITVTTTAAFGAQDDLRIITASAPAAPSASAPAANAGTNQTVNESDTVTLDGTGSFDSNSPPSALTYSWTQLSGIPVTLSGTNTATPSFTAPGVPAGGAVLTFQLSVQNSFGLSASNFVSVNVNFLNSPPTANAGPDQTVDENTLVTLDGSGSSDPDSDSLTLQWSQISGPVVTLNGADTVNPTFTTPPVALAQHFVQLQFQLVVNDGQVNSGASIVTITVVNVNNPPVADAGTNQTVNELALVTLDGTGSSDPDGDPITYRWTQILGSPTVTLTNANTATPGFFAPQLNVGGTNTSITLTFQLSVSDSLDTNTSTVDVTVKNVNHPPLADAGQNQTVPAGAAVTLDGTGSTDIDGDALSYAWAQISGTSVTLNNANTATPDFTAPVVAPAGDTLTFLLTVSDGFGGVASNTVAVGVTYVNHPPVVSTGSAQTVNEGDMVTLAGTASDPDGNSLGITWTQISGPTVTLVGATTLTPGFTAPMVDRFETNVVFQLTADDGYGGVTSDSVSIHIANINHSPVAQPPANVSVPEGTSVNLVGQGTDPDTEEQSLLVYSWTQIDGPPVTLNGTGSSVSFTAPLVTAGGDPNAKVILDFMLTVTDPDGASGSNSVQVTVANVDHSPTAVAGNNQSVNEDSAVTLNGSASSDPDGDLLTYSWVQISGPAVTLADANTPYPRFVAPFVNATGATLQFQLTVDDGFGGTNSATVTVTVNNINDPPNISQAQPSIASLWPPNHGMVKVSIVGIVDPNNNSTTTITGVTQDEPTGGTGDGDTDVDAVINPDGTVLLRAERSAQGNGRVYHIHFSAADFEGGSSGVVKVIVPLNKKSDSAIDDGELYDSTQ